MHDLSVGVRRGCAVTMREMLQQMGEVHLAAKSFLDDPASSILDIDREVAGVLRDKSLPVEHTGGVPLAGNLIPWIAEDMGDGVSKEEWKGGAETNKILGREGNPIPVESICVRVGAMRCHSQALTIKLKEDLPLAEIEHIIAGANDWVRVVENTREASMAANSRPAAVTGEPLQIPIGRLRKLSLGGAYLGAFTVGDQLLWGAAEPLRRMLRILLAR